MAIADRVKTICLSPNTEWPVIARETSTPAELIPGYLAPLAAIGAVAGFIGSVVIGTSVPFVGTVRSGIVGGLTGAVAAFVMTILGCYLIAFVINALAPTFGGQKDFNQAFKVSVYSYTPGLLAGVLQILPLLGGLVALVAGIYGLYLLYLGLPTVMKAPQDKAVGYAVVVVICAIVLGLVIGGVMAMFGMAGAMMS